MSSAEYASWCPDLAFVCSPVVNDRHIGKSSTWSPQWHVLWIVWVRSCITSSDSLWIRSLVRIPVVIRRLNFECKCCCDVTRGSSDDLLHILYVIEDTRSRADSRRIFRVFFLYLEFMKYCSPENNDFSEDPESWLLHRIQMDTCLDHYWILFVLVFLLRRRLTKFHDSCQVSLSGLWGHNFSQDIFHFWLGIFFQLIWSTVNKRNHIILN